jgi:hypothetical protein
MPNVTASAQVHARHEALGGANMRNQIADAVDETVAVAAALAFARSVTTLLNTDNP